MEMEMQIAFTITFAGGLLLGYRIGKNEVASRISEIKKDVEEKIKELEELKNKSLTAL